MPPRFDFDAALARHLEPYRATIPELQRIRREQRRRIENTLRWRIQLNCPASDLYEPALALHNEFLLKKAAYNLPQPSSSSTDPDRYVYGAIVIATEVTYPGWGWPRGWSWGEITNAELREVVTEMCIILAETSVRIQMTFPPDPPASYVGEGIAWRGPDGRWRETVRRVV